METKGWQLDPGRTFVQPNLLPKTDRSPDSARGMSRAPVAVSELVFFGRLETRKGAVTFCDAIDAILGVTHNNETGEKEIASEVWGESGSPTSETTRLRADIDTEATAPRRTSTESQGEHYTARMSEEQLLDVRSKLERVTFLGRSAIIEGEWGVEYVQRRARQWGGLPWKVVTRMDPLEAKEYLRGEGRLAVMPSKVENSPYTVYEVRPEHVA